MNKSPNSKFRLTYFPNLMLLIATALWILLIHGTATCASQTGDEEFVKKFYERYMALVIKEGQHDINLEQRVAGIMGDVAPGLRKMIRREIKAASGTDPEPIDHDWFLMSQYWDKSWEKDIDVRPMPDGSYLVCLGKPDQSHDALQVKLIHTGVRPLIASVKEAHKGCR